MKKFKAVELSDNTLTEKEQVIKLYKEGKSQSEIAGILKIDFDRVVSYTKHLGIHVGKPDKEEDRKGDDPQSKQYYGRTLKKDSIICSECNGSVSDSANFCTHCGSQLSDSIPMFKIDKNNLTIKFISTGTMKDFMSTYKKSNMFSVTDKEKAIVTATNLAELKSAEEWLTKNM